jgi:hypothetical protein
MFDTCHIQAAEYIDGDAFENLRISGVTYVKTDEVRPFLESGSASGVLVTHNSDLGIDDKLAALAFGNNPNLAAWFGQNVRVRHPRLIPVPIGLERVRWFPHLRKRDQLRELAARSPEMPSELCLANFSVSTNARERLACLDSASSFATLRAADTVCQDTPESYGSYLTEILEHKFVLCPEGNGVDTHRLWETLYLGRIPVVTRSVVTEAFSEIGSATLGAATLGPGLWPSATLGAATLPMVILDSWADLSRARLQTCWDDFREGRASLNLSRLLMSFWRDRIASAAGHCQAARW